MPVLSGTVAATGMSDKTLYPTFSRIRSTNAYGAVSAVQFISYYGWDQVVVICSPTDAYSIEYHGFGCWPDRTADVHPRA